MEKTHQISIIDRVQQEIATELKNEKAMKMLLATTFKGLNEVLARQAMFEGMVRGFTFKDFVEKNVYALKYGAGYSLITSIDHVRKIAMKNGQCGKSSPVYTFKSDGSVDTCEVTVERSSDGVIGKYSALVYFNEFDKKENLWKTKPKMMIAKVAEMHALRQAFPEELSKLYTEDEMQKENDKVSAAVVVDGKKAVEKLKATQTAQDLAKAWASLSADERAIEEVLFTYNEEVRSYDNP